ncbi:hypothetical protein SELMODRAFT_135385 [Selaginella moellendorffii]|uniref:Methyltransferase type 11 domain-containing protein n=2 Tax=Selaginella moellendorffii TaxID=88036 RepID=D8TA78_SELML|nr:hypothetical protein SELMODRAFT_135385 [Selaginella moellendorffii]
MWSVAWNLLLVASIVSTNLMALYSLSVSRGVRQDNLLSPSSTPLLAEIASLREEIRQALTAARTRPSAGSRSLLMSSELLEYTEERSLPLGRNPTHGGETMVSPIGHACFQHMALLDTYMNYTVGSLCPDDWNIAQALMVRGCEPLPRRRCFARSPPSYSTPLPLPGCRWSTPPDDTIRWSHYTCKSFDCLNRRAKESKVFVDCADCFELTGAERTRWVVPRGKNDVITIKDLVALKRGSLRIGLDIGGGTASFAARMAEHNVTIVTTSLNLNGPFNEFIALRGLVPIFLTVGQRLPFFDNTLDLVHSMHVLSSWIPTRTLEFILFDIDRVLRPGGILWLDHFFCTQDQLHTLYAPMVERLGYTKLKWVAGLKLDKNGIKNHEVYLSALLEKPVRSSSSSS